ncbi:hypothetical protein SAY87_031849 [Trapa incisa]|uniref:RING-type E3 ubiquitin transferase n=1 Tax=Trapa incisa TaxID=236973 RepID=A0AAN7QLC1_9MYRT|nr:hypothetical protein SAY87_031849 [Trapa incisa]
MLQIRLKREPSSEVSGGGKPPPTDTVTVACPDHLILADLPVGKGLGPATSATIIKAVGHTSRRQRGERVHFCVRCDFPIAIYGRLSPCEHVFCLDCARKDSICYICDERIEKIQTVKMMEGIFICAAHHCLKSYMKKSEFEAHIHESHYDLLYPNADVGNESEAQSQKQHPATDSTASAPPRQAFLPGPLQQLHDHGDEVHNLHSYKQVNGPSQSQSDSWHPPDQHSLQQQPGHIHGKQHGIPSNVPFHEYPPLNPIPQPNFMMPSSSNTMLNPPLPFGFPPHQPEGGAQFFSSGPYNMVRQDSAPEAVAELGPSFGLPPSGMNFAGTYPAPWNAEMGESHFKISGPIQGLGDNYQSQGDLMRGYPGASPSNPSMLPFNMQSSGSAE